MSEDIDILIAIESAICRAEEIRTELQFMTEAELIEKSYAMDDELDNILSAGAYMLRIVINKIETEKALYERKTEVLQ